LSNSPYLFALGTYSLSSTLNVPKSLTLTPEDPYAEAKPVLDDGGTLSRIITIAADDVTIDGLEVANGKEDLIRQSGADFQPTLYNHQFDHLLDSRLSLASLYADLTTRRTSVPWSSRGKRHTPWSTDKTLAVPQTGFKSKNGTQNNADAR
jgi:hypothetical protein